MSSRARLSDLKTLWQRKQQGSEARNQVSEKQHLAQGRGAKAPFSKGERGAKRGAPPATPQQTPAAFGGTPFGKGAKRERDVDFQRQMRDEEVIPLPPSRRVVVKTPRPAPVPKQRLRDETEVLALAKYGESSSPTMWDIGQEMEDDQTFLRVGLSPDILRKLRRGQWAIQSELDLHGMVVDEAHDALVDFLIEARSHGLRCVRIIHGKGLTSPGKIPVLKGRVRRWLASWGDVLAYCEAAHHSGGGGAVLVLLRGK
ncbi:MAG: Smr/MutS family protein [Burkholderiales bacterium]|jgi:DNA-nicking Smr family endonuclease|nr:Smr/MutS family protein [Burkholderiales bacterium]